MTLTPTPFRNLHGRKLTVAEHRQLIIQHSTLVAAAKLGGLATAEIINLLKLAVYLKAPATAVYYNHTTHQWVTLQDLPDKPLWQMVARHATTIRNQHQEEILNAQTRTEH